MSVFSKANVEDLHAAMVSALAEQQNEELALCKAQLAVEQEKNAQLERRVASLKAQLKQVEVAVYSNTVDADEYAILFAVLSALDP